MSTIKQKVRCFIDTNIWLYAFIETGDVKKTKKAKYNHRIKFDRK